MENRSEPDAFDMIKARKEGKKEGREGGRGVRGKVRERKGKERKIPSLRKHRSRKEKKTLNYLTGMIFRQGPTSMTWEHPMDFYFVISTCEDCYLK